MFDLDFARGNIAVIIPVLNNYERFNQCLISLDSQTIGRESYQIIVVDNGSDDERTLNIAKEYADLVLYQTKLKSPYPSRNLGIRATDAYYKILIDSNIIVPKNFILDGIRQLESLNVDFGSPRIDFELDENSDIWEKLDSITYVNIEENINKGKVPGGCVITKDHFFSKYGYFDEHCRSGADTKWAFQATQQGAKLGFLSDITTTYPPKKKDDLLRKAKRIGKGVRSNSDKNLRYYLLSFIKFLPSSPFNIFNKVKKSRNLSIQFPIIRLWLADWQRRIYTGIGMLGL